MPGRNTGTGTSKLSQYDIDKESQDNINNGTNKKYLELSETYNLRHRKHPKLPIEYNELHAMLHLQKQLCQKHYTLLTKYGVSNGLRFHKEEFTEAVIKELIQLHKNGQ